MCTLPTSTPQFIRNKWILCAWEIYYNTLIGQMHFCVCVNDVQSANSLSPFLNGVFWRQWRIHLVISTPSFCPPSAELSESALDGTGRPHFYCNLWQFANKNHSTYKGYRQVCFEHSQYSGVVHQLLLSLMLDKQTCNMWCSIATVGGVKA